MFHLRSLRLNEFDTALRSEYPFNLALIQALPEIHFSAPVTFFVGENGSGKSTLLESLACAVGSITVGAEPVDRDPTLAPARALANCLRLSWAKKTHKGLFLRAEDYFGYVKYIAKTQAELQQELIRTDEENKGRSRLAQAYARAAYSNELGAIHNRYREGLDARSHGESFLQFFGTRLVPNGLYLLDEPEAALSPNRLLTLLAMLSEMVQQHAQFIIATHSPILLAFPNAAILQFDGASIRPIAYDDVEQVSLTRSFLKNPAAYLRHLTVETQAIKK